MEQHVQLAQRLPSQLLRFFTKFPPPQIAAAATTTVPPPESQTITTAENTSSSDPNLSATETTHIAQGSVDLETSPIWSKRAHNPFLPFKNPRTGNWHGPAYSLRRQAQLFKLAVANDVLPLMPLSPKHPEVKLQKRIDHGLRVQGTGLGKKVKGKYWERTMAQRLDERRKAMEAMPEMVRQWKERGHGRGWKKWPK